MKIYTVPKMMNIELYCNICDKLCIELFFKNHLKSQSHINKIIISNNST